VPIEPADPQAGGWLSQVRERADRAGERYQQLAQSRPLLGLPLAFAARYTGRQGILLASAVAFRLFLWLAPLALVLAGVLSAYATGGDRDVDAALRAAGITGAARTEVANALIEAHRSWWYAVLIGSVLLLWGTRTLVKCLTLVNAHAWDASLRTYSRRDQVRRVLIVVGAWGAVIIVAGVISRLDGTLPGGLLLPFLIQVLVVAGAWLLVSMHLPDRRTSWAELVPGSVLFGLAITVLNTVSRVYLPYRFERSSRLYGSLGLATVMLAWLLVIGQVIVSAALINAVWAQYRALKADEATVEQNRTPPG
jgi:membrane protein